MTAKATKREDGHASNVGSQDGKSRSTNPFLMRFLKPLQIGQGDPGKTIYTYVKRETTDDR